MDDLETQLSQLAEHRDSLAAADESGRLVDALARVRHPRWLVAAAVVAIVGASSAWFASRGDDEPVAVGGPTTTDPGFCGDALPVFFAGTADTALGGVDGTPGPGPGSNPAEPGQRVAHWTAEYDIVIELRWPGTPVPDGATTTPFAGGLFTAHLWQTPTESGPDRYMADIPVAGATGPCATVSAEAFAPRADPIPDYFVAFVGALRPASERDAFVGERRDLQTRATAGDRPDGRCGVPFPAALDERGEIDLESRRTLVMNFLADRVAGNAAEPCLSNQALETYRDSQAWLELPGLCLYECDDVRVLAGTAEMSLGSVSALVDYERSDGSIQQVRESYTFDLDDAGAAFIADASIGPDSLISEEAGRRVIGDFIDSAAAGEYALASRYLINEGTSPEVSERIGEYGGETSFESLFAAFCRTAACEAPYVVGPTIEVSDARRVFSVRFETSEGPIDVPIGVGWFEGVTSVQNLPPDGTGPGVDRTDRRIFGTAYPGSLTVVRERAVERYRAGDASWVGDYQLRLAGPLALAGDFVITSPSGSQEEGASAFVPGDPAPDGPGRSVVTLEGRAAGASTVEERPLVFLRTGDQDFRLMVTDLDTGAEADVFPGTTFGDETPWSADATADRIAVLMVAGDSATVNVYEFDAETLAAGRLLTRLVPEAYLGAPHLAPDGRTLAATLDNTFYDPTTSVAVFDTDSGAVIDRWTVAEGVAIESIDYDGRWIVAHLDDARLWVIDTSDGSTRRVDLSVQVAFG